MPARDRPAPARKASSVRGTRISQRTGTVFRSESETMPRAGASSTPPAAARAIPARTPALRFIRSFRKQDRPPGLRMRADHEIVIVDATEDVAGRQIGARPVEHHRSFAKGDDAPGVGEG